MALLGTITKQPREIIDFDISYASFLVGRTDSLASIVTEVTGVGLGVLYSTISGSSVKAVLTGGTDGQSYKVTVITTTTAGLVLEDEITVLVEEV